MPHTVLQTVPQLYIHIVAQFSLQDEQLFLHPKHDISHDPAHVSVHEVQPLHFVEHACLQSLPQPVHFSVQVPVQSMQVDESIISPPFILH